MEIFGILIVLGALIFALFYEIGEENLIETYEDVLFLFVLGIFGVSLLMVGYFIQTRREYGITGLIGSVLVLVGIINVLIFFEWIFWIFISIGHVLIGLSFYRQSCLETLGNSTYKDEHFLTIRTETYRVYLQLLCGKLLTIISNWSSINLFVGAILGIIIYFEFKTVTYGIILLFFSNIIIVSLAVIIRICLARLRDSYRLFPTVANNIIIIAFIIRIMGYIYILRWAKPIVSGDASVIPKDIFTEFIRILGPFIWISFLLLVKALLIMEKALCRHGYNYKASEVVKDIKKILIVIIASPVILIIPVFTPWLFCIYMLIMAPYLSILDAFRTFGKIICGES